MFGRKDDSEERKGTVPEVGGAGDEGPGLTSALSRETAARKAASAGRFRPELPRRVAQLPGTLRPAAPESDNDKTLTVGREIRLSGDISACEKLVVEGRVEAKLDDCRLIEISPSGYFKGTVEVDEAVISGGFQGTLAVRGRLWVRATGRVSGEIRYGDLEVERGGRISGTIDQGGADETEAETPESESA